MAGRVALVRALTGEVIHPEVEVIAEDDTRRLSAPGSVTLTVPIEWHQRKAPDGSPFFGKRQTLVVVERANGAIRQVGLVDDLQPGVEDLQVSCGGVSMLAGQSGPWEGHQGYYVDMDPVVLFRRIWEQVQAYKNSDLGIRITGDKTSGSSVGSEGSRRYQAARKQYNKYLPSLNTWEGRLLSRERTLSQRKERMFKAAGLKRVGDVKETDDGGKPPEDPGWKADSTLWIRKDRGELGHWGRAHRWRDGRWVSQSQADSAVRGYRGYVSTVEAAKDEVDRLKYLMAPHKDLMDEYENEAREEYSLYFWQNHDLGDVIEELLPMGPFEFKETARWVDDKNTLDLQLQVGVPTVGVRRDEPHLELGFNVQGEPERQYGDAYTEVAQFGAGTGSEVLSEQRSWNPKHVVRNVLVDTDKDAYNRSLTRSAANKLRDLTRDQSGLKFTKLTVSYGKACPEGSFDVGDIIPLTGRMPDGLAVDQLLRVVAMQHTWGADEVVIEVEKV